MTKKLSNRFNLNENNLSEFLKSTYFLDSNNPLIISEVNKILNEIFPSDLSEDSPKQSGTDKDLERIDRDNIEQTKKIAKRLFYFVRDQIKYKVIYHLFSRREMKAGNILKKREGFCVSKAVLLATFGRAAGIPTRLHFADIVNYKASRRVLEIMGTDVFVFHGYCEFLLNGKWVKLTPAFDKEVSLENGFPLVEFNGDEDAIFPKYDENGEKFIEYKRDRGIYSDLPYDEIIEAWIKAYGGHFSSFKGQK
ncbi:MAG: transglutaminase-like domain-containing protein [Promethearchaeota archaeon]